MWLVEICLTMFDYRPCLVSGCLPPYWKKVIYKSQPTQTPPHQPSYLWLPQFCFVFPLPQLLPPPPSNLPTEFVKLICKFRCYFYILYEIEAFKGYLTTRISGCYVPSFSTPLEGFVGSLGYMESCSGLVAFGHNSGPSGLM